MILRSSQRFWHLRLVGEYKRAYDGEDQFCCSGKATIMNPPKHQTPPVQSEPDVQSDAGGRVDIAQGSQGDIDLVAFYRDGSINPRGVNVLHQVLSLVGEEARDITIALRKDPPPKERPVFVYPPKLAMAMPQCSPKSMSRYGTSSKSPSRGSPGGTTPNIEPCQYEHVVQQSPIVQGSRKSKRAKKQRAGKDFEGDSIMLEPILVSKDDHEEKSLEKSIAWIKLGKSYSKYECSVYANDIIRSTPLFPLLLSYKRNCNAAILIIEQVVPMGQFVEKFPERWDSPTHIHMTVARFLLDLMGALRTLHSFGFVHADISPNNVGYNQRTGTWQLFDFDHALPIDVAANKPTRGGTRGYRSIMFKETGLFTTFDDYISLMLACRYGFLYPRYCTIDLFCDVFKRNDLTDTEADPSHVQAKKIIGYDDQSNK